MNRNFIAIVIASLVLSESPAFARVDEQQVRVAAHNLNVCTIAQTDQRARAMPANSSTDDIKTAASSAVNACSRFIDPIARAIETPEKDMPAARVHFYNQEVGLVRDLLTKLLQKKAAMQGR